MTVAYFDTIAGISGDMTLGAFIDAGMPVDVLTSELKKLDLGRFEIECEHVITNGISATKVNVVVPDDATTHRHPKDIEAIIDRSEISSPVKALSKKIFSEVAAAEAKVHRVPVEKVHFHEVGALDSILDIVGTALCLDRFGCSAIYSSPVKIGRSGFVQSQHGTIPVPTPATVEILKDYPVLLTGVDAELTTPTGAAIIKALSRGTLHSDQFRITHVGYGAGSKEISGIPNLLRIMIGELPTSEDVDSVVVLETNIDDLNPELYPHVLEKLFAAGAIDAYMTPVIMKKGRPGIVLSALARRNEANGVTAALFRETSTLGIRVNTVDRRTLKREERIVQTSFGPMRVKFVEREAKSVPSLEFEECKRISDARGLPLQEVYRILEKELHSM